MPRRPTSADVASAAGVSRTTVSFVLNGRSDVKIPAATRIRVLEAADRLDYHPHAPARQLAGGRSHVIALVLRQTPEQIAADAILAETLRGLATAARAGGFRVMVEPLAPDGPDATYASLLRAQHADGLVISGPRTDDPQLEALVREGFPVVLQGALPGLDAPSVDVDNVAGARHAVEHLVALGHRRIACITNAPLVYTAAQERLEGYRDALATAGLAHRRDAHRDRRLRRPQRPCGDARPARPDDVRCGLRGQRRRGPRGHRRAARGRHPSAARLSASWASTTSPSQPTSTHP